MTTQLPAWWREEILVDLLESLIDYRGKTPEKSNHWILTLSAKSVKMWSIDYNQAYYISKETYDKFMVRWFPKQWDILMTTEAPLGIIAKLDRDDVAVAQRLLTLRGKKWILDNDFLMYFLMSDRWQHELSSRASGSTVEGIKRSEFERVKILIPESLPEQVAIASLLSSFDDKIELLREQNKTLENLGQTIFQEWFGKYSVDEPEILPEGWRVGNLGEVVLDSIWGDYWKENIEDEYNVKTLCLRGTDLPDMKNSLPNRAPIRYLKSSKLEKCKLINGDIVIEISGWTEWQSTGRSIYINKQILENSELPITCVNFCRIIRPIDENYTYFLYSYLEFLYNKWVFFNLENWSTGIKNLNLNTLLNEYELVIPIKEMILNFNTKAKKIFEKIQFNNSQIQSLTASRDTLLPKLMSGEVRVEF